MLNLMSLLRTKRFNEKNCLLPHNRFSGTAIVPALPISALPFSSEITEITSAGSSKCQLANVSFELAPTVTENT